MNIKYIGLLTATLLSVLTHAQRENNVKDLLGLFNGEQRWILPAVDSSMCIIRQEYTLIDSSGNEFGADGKSYWGMKYGLGIITDSAIYSLGSILSPWTGDKDLEVIKKTDPRKLQPRLSRRLYKRPADKGFEQWKSKALSDSAVIGTNKGNGASTSLKIKNGEKYKKENKNDLPANETSPDHPINSPAPKTKEGVKPFANVENTGFLLDSQLVKFTVPDSTSSVPVAVNDKDTTGWLVLVSGKYNGTLSDSSQLVYAIVKPSYVNTSGDAKMYIKKPAAVKQNLLGGIYYTARFSCGKIAFSAAGLLSQDEKGWFIHSLTTKPAEAPPKPAAAVTPIKNH